MSGNWMHLKGLEGYVECHALQSSSLIDLISYI